MFDIKKFDSCKIKQRTKDIPVPQLKSFFPENGEVVFKARALSGSDYGRINQEVKENKVEIVRKLKKVVEGGDLVSICKGFEVFVDESKKILPDDIIFRTYWILFGCIEPELNLEQVIKIRENFADTFYDLSNKINELSNMGNEVMGE
jgi:hypothetical protein